MAANGVGLLYDAGTTADPSTIDEVAGNGQIRQEWYNKKAIIDIKDEMILGQLSGTMAQPKHQGKAVVKHRYLPLLDDANANPDSGIDTDGTTLTDGNLYGSSRGTGFISDKLPDLSEDSERVNKVSFSRKEVRGTIVNRGFFFEWSKDEVAFDTDAQMLQHVTTEATRGANQINEDVLAIELINGAGIVQYAGGVASIATVDETAVPTLRDLIRIDTELDNNKCPKDTKIIVGSKLTDTKTVQAARYMFISPDMKMDFMSIKALNGTDDAFVPVHQYADANMNGKYVKSIPGEIGVVGPFRLVVHPKMVRYSETDGGASGAAWATDPATDPFRNDGSNFEVYPNLIVGSESFTHIGFEYGAGTKGKFNVTTKSPESLRSRENPYGKMGMTVIEFWNGILIERPEWIAVYNTASQY